MPKNIYIGNVEGLYRAIKDDLNERYHKPGLTIDGRGIPANEYHDGGDPHASDGYIVQGNYASNDGGKTWTHLEHTSLTK